MPEDISTLSLPGLLELTSADHPQREAFLSALSKTLRNGVLQSDTNALADSVLLRGFDSAEAAG